MLIDGKKLRLMIEAIPSLLPVGACADMKRFAERIKDRQLACLKECEVEIQPPGQKQFVVDGGELIKKIREHKHQLGLGSKGGLDACIAAQLEWCVNILDSCRLPLQPPERIEAAIRGCEKRAKDPKALDEKYFWELADLLRWVLGQPQPTWKPEDFGLGPEKEGLEPVTDKDRRY